MKNTVKKILITSFSLAAALCLTQAAVEGFNAKAYENETDVIATFDVGEKASVRVTDPNGIRFTTKVNKAYFAEQTEAGATFGSLIIPASALGDNAITDEGVTAIDTVFSTEKVYEEDDTYYTFTTVLTAIPDSYYDTKIVSVSYMKPAEGAVVYSATTAERSLAQVASLALQAGQTEEVLTQMVDTAITVNGTDMANATLSVYIGEEKTLTVENVGNMTPVWASDNEEVATVVNGKVTAKASGAANITATLGSSVKTYALTVPEARTDAPTAAPVLDSKVMVLNDSFSIVAEEDTEYRVVTENGDVVCAWQSAGAFSGLSGNTKYFVEARRPANETNSASAIGELKLEVTTLEGALASDFERMGVDSGVGNLVVTDEKAHNGNHSIKSSTPDGEYGFVLHPNALLERQDSNGNKYNGSWPNGSYEENYINVQGYKYISFWAYFETDATLNSGIEMWKENYGDVFNCGVGQQIKGGSWQRVVIDMTVNGVLRGDFDDICAHVAKIYINFYPVAASTYGAFYIDEITFLKAAPASTETPDEPEVDPNVTLASNFEKISVGNSVGNLVVSNEKAHSGNNSLKSSTSDGAYGFILNPNCLMDNNGTNGSWTNGSYSENYINVQGYKYISFWAYFEQDVTIGSGVEIWKTVGGDVFNCGVGQQIKGGSWQHVVIDMTVNGVLRGDFDDICSHVGRIYINFAWVPATEIGTFYIDDIAFSK